jgi:hypothetical protein
MAISVVCEACGKKFGAPDSFAGKQVRCRGCGATLTVPGGDTSPQLVPNGSESPLGTPLVAGGILQPIAADDTAVGAAVSTGDGEDDGDEFVPRRERKLRWLYGNPYMRLLDQWLPLASCVIGLLWTGFSISGQTYQTPGGAFETIPGWIAASRLASICLLYGALIFPLTLAGLRIAAKSMNIPMPAAVKWRLFASYVPSVTLAIVIWNAGGGATPALIFGAILGLIVSTACMAVLFRLEIEEIPLVAGHTGGGFALGSVISGVLLYGINLATIVGITNGKSANPPPASPYWSGFDWESKLADMRAAPGGKTPAPAKPTPAAGTPAPAPPVTPTPDAGKPAGPNPPGDAPPPKPKPKPIKRSPAARSILDPVDGSDDPSPVLGKETRDLIDVSEDLWRILRPLGGRGNIAVVVRQESGKATYEPYDTREWKSLEQRPLRDQIDTKSIERTHALSPDGSKMAYITTSLGGAIQIRSFTFADGVDKQICKVGSMERSPELIGFLDENRILWRCESANGSGGTTLEISSTGIAEPIDIPLNATVDPSQPFLTVDHAHKTVAYFDRSHIHLVSLEARKKIGDIDVSDMPSSLTPIGMAFSTDDKEIAVYYSTGSKSELLSYSVGTGKKTAEFSSPVDPIPNGTHPNFNGNVLTWWPGGRKWLICGDALIEPVDDSSGRLVGRIEIPDVVQQHFADANTVELIVERGGKWHLVRVELNLSGH